MQQHACAVTTERDHEELAELRTQFRCMRPAAWRCGTALYRRDAGGRRSGASRCPKPRRSRGCANDPGTEALGRYRRVRDLASKQRAEVPTAGAELATAWANFNAAARDFLAIEEGRSPPTMLEAAEERLLAAHAPIADAFEYGVRPRGQATFRRLGI